MGLGLLTWKTNLRGAGYRACSNQCAADLSRRQGRSDHQGPVQPRGQWQGVDLTAACTRFARPRQPAQIRTLRWRRPGDDLAGPRRSPKGRQTCHDASQEIRLAEASLEMPGLRGGKVALRQLQGGNMQGCKDCPRIDAGQQRPSRGCRESAGGGRPTAARRCQWPRCTSSAWNSCNFCLS